MVITQIGRLKLQAAALLLVLSARAVSAQGSFYLVANFDDLPAGGRGMGPSFSDGGITFSNADRRDDPTGGPGAFSLQSTYLGSPSVSFPNYLTFGGYVPGIIQGFSFTRCGSFDVGFVGTASSASMDVFAESDLSTDALVLQALLGTTVVDTDVTDFHGSGAEVVFRQLRVTGQFDSLRLMVNGPDSSQALLFGVDNVRVEIVPEPPEGLLMFCAMLLFAVHHCRKKSVVIPAA